MSFLFDASSIFEAIIRGVAKVLSGNYTIELARYELGSIVWKKATLLGSVDESKYVELIYVLKKLLNIMKIVNIECSEHKVLKLANELKITFYDASYVYKAKELNVPLVTEDRRLADKVVNHIRTLKVDDILRGSS